jgi:hypothetical protein
VLAGSLLSRLPATINLFVESNFSAGGKDRLRAPAHEK